MNPKYYIAVFIMLFGLFGMLAGLAAISIEYALLGFLVFLGGFVLTQKFL